MCLVAENRASLKARYHRQTEIPLITHLQVRTEAAVAAKDLLVNDRGDRQAIEAIREGLPELDVVSPLALVVKTVYPVYAGALVIAAQQEKILRILDLVRQQQAYRFQGLLAPVDVVAQEQVICLGRETAVLEEPQQIGVLAVYVAADLKRRLQLQQNRLLQENLPRLETEATHLGLRHGDGLARSTSSDCATEMPMVNRVGKYCNNTGSALRQRDE